MKKLFYPCLFFAAMAMTTSCSQDEEIVQPSNGDMTTFKVQLDGATKSRTAGDGQTVDKLYYAVYDNNGTKVIYPNPNEGNYKTAPITDGTASVSLPLMKTEEYKIVFWAQTDGTNAYTFTELTDIKVNYDGLESNQENRDAFFNAFNFEADGETETVMLYRPFAQLNVATAIDDWNEAVRQYQANGNTDYPVKYSSVTVDKLATNFNAMDGKATGSTTAEIVFGKKDILDESIYIGENADEYKLLAMNYVMMPAIQGPTGLNSHDAAPEDGNKDLVKVEFTLWKDADNKIMTASVDNVPIQRNFRTNIIGSFLTGDQTQFNIVVDAEFDGDKNEPGITFEDEKKIARIYSADGLKYFRDLVNGNKSRAAAGETFAGWTIYLEKEIDLANEAWEPIGLNADDAKKFMGTFDGKGNIIRNLKVETEAGYTAAGFFGALNGTAKNFTIDGATIKHISTANAEGQTDNGIAVVAGSIYNKGNIENVTVKNASVEGNRLVGGIAGYTYGNIKDCTVETITLTATPDNLSGSYDNGDKVGGIAGYWGCENTYVISGNKVNGATIKGYRDLGGIVGSGLNGAAKVTNNIVSNTTIVADQTVNYYEDKDSYVGAIIGRINTNETIDESNEAVDVNLSTVKNNEEGKPVSEMTLVGDMQVSTGTTIHTQTSTGPVTINGNGNTIVSTAESVDDFTWEGGTIPAMSTIFSSTDGSKVTVNDLKFTGTMSALMLGHYVDSNSNWYNTEMNNVDVIDAKVVSFSANISPAVVIYGTATLNGCNIYGTTLSELDTDPMWPVYDVAAVNYSTTTLKNCKIGSFYIWNQAGLIVDESTEIQTLVVRGNMNTSKYGVTIKSGTKVEIIDLSAITNKTKVNFTIEEGATVGKFVVNGVEYDSLDAYKNAE